MKRLTPKRRRWLKQRARYEAKKHANRRAFRRKPRRFITVKLSGVLDLIDNENETRLQFQQLGAIRPPGYKGARLSVYFDIGDVTGLEACALLYLVAHVRRVRSYAGVKVSGNYPTAVEALRLLRDANFEQFIGIKMRIGPRAPVGPSLQLTRGQTAKKLDPTDWLALYNFIRVHGSLTDDETEALYTAFGECVENVRQHAYRSGEIGSWYAVALRPSADAPARMVVLDLGVGIASSVRRNFGDRLRLLIGTVLKAFQDALTRAGIKDDDETEFERRLASDDWFCSYMATLGLRTQTGGRERGTGLSGLRQTVLETQRGAMHVLSGEAIVTWAHGYEPEANRLAPLWGTAVCLDIGAPKAPDSRVARDA